VHGKWGGEAVKEGWQVKSFEFYFVIERLTNFSIEGQIIYILGISGHPWSLLHILLCFLFCAVLSKCEALF
jgi:hypothetical protein